jgi:hypothetical protein
MIPSKTGVRDMWRVARGDLHRARENLGYRLAETLMRQQSEVKSLRAKHADELHVLEPKQAELNSLEAMIDRFADEFQTAAQTEAAHQEEPTTEAPDGALQQSPEAEIPASRPPR